MINALGASWRLGRIGPTEVRLHWSVLVLCAAIYVTRDLARWQSILSGTIDILIVLSAVVLHELGHVVVARRLGYESRQIMLWALGGVALLDYPPRRPRDQLAIAAAGPLTNIAVAGVLAALLWASDSLAGPGWDRTVALRLQALGLPFLLSTQQIGQFAVFINLALGLFNMLPIFPLDGGQIVQGALTVPLGVQRANRVIFWLSSVLGAALLVWVLVQRDVLGTITALLLLLATATLNPRAARAIARGMRAILMPSDYLAIDRHDLRGALTRAERSVASGHRLPENWILCTYIYTQMGDLTRGAAAADQALTLIPTGTALYAIARYNRGWFAWVRGDLAAARGDMDAALAITPQAGNLLQGSTILARAAGDDARALADVTSAITVNPASIDARYLRAELRWRGGDLAGAREDAAFVFGDREGGALSFIELERQQIMRGQQPWAAQLAAWAIDHSWIAARVARVHGDIARVNGDDGAAVEHYTQVLAATPHDTDTRYWRAVSAMALGAFERAQADVTHILAATPTPWLREQTEARRAALSNRAMTSLPVSSDVLPTAMQQNQQSHDHHGHEAPRGHAI